MADSKSMDYGWFFLRLSVGITFLAEGVERFDPDNVELYVLALLLSGLATVLGLLVRPATIFLLVMMVSVFVSGDSLEFNLVRDSLTELLALVGFLLGGGGTFLALGASISGLKDKWYQ